jgi:hypothetical protein
MQMVSQTRRARPAANWRLQESVRIDCRHELPATKVGEGCRPTADFTTDIKYSATDRLVRCCSHHPVFVRFTVPCTRPQLLCRIDYTACWLTTAVLQLS